MPRVLHLKSSRSTQTLARRMAERGAPAWTLVRADRQTRGRGRMERSWSSGKGGLYVSLILRPRLTPAGLAGLSLAAAKACARALAAPGLELFIKPPNDILARRAGSAEPARKVCGILLEASGDTQAVDWVVLGIGVNAANRLPRALSSAATLSELSGRRVGPEAVLPRLLRRLRGIGRPLIG